MANRMNTPGDYNPKQADYNLRETISNIKAQVDQIHFGFLERLDAEAAAGFISRLKKATDGLYDLLNQAILEKANKINELHGIILEDLLMADKIQKNILECDVSDWNGLQVDIRYLPMSEVGGDFYNLFEMNPGCFRVFLADATGHGIQAALVTMLIKSEYETIKRFHTDPALILETLNDTFINTFGNLTVFFTCIVLDIDTNANRITLASAGHPPQFLLHDSSETVVSASGVLLGARPGARYRQVEHCFKPGDRLLLFTDGLFEEFSANNEEYGETRMLEMMRSARALPLDGFLDSLIGAVTHFLKGQPWNDDMTLIGIDFRNRPE